MKNNISGGWATHTLCIQSLAPTTEPRIGLLGGAFLHIIAQVNLKGYRVVVLEYWVAQDFIANHMRLRTLNWTRQKVGFIKASMLMPSFREFSQEKVGPKFVLK